MLDTKFERHIQIDNNFKFGWKEKITSNNIHEDNAKMYSIA